MYYTFINDNKNIGIDIDKEKINKLEFNISFRY